MDLTGKIVKFWVTNPDDNNGAPTAPAIVTRDWHPTSAPDDPSKYVNLKVIGDNGEPAEWHTSVFHKSGAYPVYSYELYPNCCKKG